MHPSDTQYGLYTCIIQELGLVSDTSFALWGCDCCQIAHAVSIAKGAMHDEDIPCCAMQISENYSAPTKNNVRETSLFTGAIPSQVRNSQTSRFVSVPGQNPGRSS